MSDFLNRIAAKNLSLSESVQPRWSSLFEPPSPDGFLALELRFDHQEQVAASSSDGVEPSFHSRISPPSPLHLESTGVSSPSGGTAKKIPIGQSERDPSVGMVEDETAGRVHRKADDLQPPPNATIPSLLGPDPEGGSSRPGPEGTGTVYAEFYGEAARAEKKTFHLQPPKKSQDCRRLERLSPAKMGTEQVRIADGKTIDKNRASYDKIQKKTSPGPKGCSSRPHPGGFETTSSEGRDEEKPPVLERRADRSLNVRARSAGKAFQKISDPPSTRKASPGAKTDRLGSSVEWVGGEPGVNPGQGGANPQSPASGEISVPIRRVLEKDRILPSPNSSENLEAYDTWDRGRKVLRGAIIDRSAKVEIDLGDIASPARGPIHDSHLSKNGPRDPGIGRSCAIRFEGPRKRSSPQPTETSPMVHVKIGRVEVRAATMPAPTSKPPRKAKPSAQKLSLDEYLKERSGGRP